MSTTDISGTLSVGSRIFLRGTDISGALNAYGDTILVDCNVTGHTQLDTLNISGDLPIDSSCNIGYLNVQGDTVLNDVTITGFISTPAQSQGIDISGLNVDGSCNIGGDLYVQGDTVLNNLVVRGFNNLEYTSLDYDFLGYMNAGGPCSLNEDTTIGGTMHVSQNSQCSDVDISGYLNVNGSCNVESIHVQGNTVLHDVTITGTNSIVYTSDNWYIADYLVVDGSCNIGGNTTMGGALSVEQNSQFNRTDISGYLNVDGNSEINGNLKVVGNVNVNGSVYVNNNNFVVNCIDSTDTSTNASTVSIPNNGYLYNKVTSSSINMYASGLPMFGYIVWFVDQTSSYTYAPTFPIISSCAGTSENRMGLVDRTGYLQNSSLFINFIVVSPYTKIVFYDSLIEHICDNSTSFAPKTFENSIDGVPYIHKISSWFVYRYTRNGTLLDNGYFLSENPISGTID